MPIKPYNEKQNDFDLISRLCNDLFNIYSIRSSMNVSAHNIIIQIKCKIYST